MVSKCKVINSGHARRIRDNILCAKCDKLIPFNKTEMCYVNNGKIYHAKCYEEMFIETDELDISDEELEEYFLKSPDKEGVTITKKMYASH